MGKLRKDGASVFETYEGQTLLISLGAANITDKHYPALDGRLTKLGIVIYNAFGSPVGYQFGYTDVKTPCIKLFFPPETFAEAPLEKCQKIIDYIENEFK